MTRSASVLWCLAASLCLPPLSARGQEPTPDFDEAQALAESIVAREEAASDRAFDPTFRTKAKTLLAALPLAELVSQTGDNGLGLNALGDTQADLVYTPLTPCRIVDTRAAGGPIAAGTTRSFLVTGTNYSAQGGSATGCGVPYGPTTAAVINFVAVSPTGQGNLQVTPHGSPLPTASIINYSAGVNLANGLVVAICNPSAATCSRDVTIKANVSATGLVADVQGYFQRVTTGGVGTALLADGAVTAPKIASGVVVRSLNGLADAVTLAAGSNVSITPTGNTLTVSATPGGGGGDITAVNTPLTGGLQGGATSGEANLGLVTCGAAQLLKSSGAAWACAADSDTGVNGVIAGGGITGSIAARTLTLGSTATATNTGGAIVARDGSGSFAAGNLNLAGNLDLPNTTASAGMVTLGGLPFLHRFGSDQNTFVGNAGNLTMSGGGYNSALGWAALASNTTGESNTALGALTLFANTTGSYNSAVGLSALSTNSTGHSNSAVGNGALSANTTGAYNSALGLAALGNNTTGNTNAALGGVALIQNTTGAGNTAVGFAALSANSTGNSNTAVGIGALGYNTASDNTAVGNAALQSNTLGTPNTAVGSVALYNNTTGSHNSAFGQAVLLANTTGDYNVAFGEGALGYSTTGTGNAAFGSAALLNTETGSFNIAIGHAAGASLISGDRNIYIGADAPVTSESGVIRIGDTSQNATYLAGISGATSAGGVGVYVNADGKLGTVTSSRRYKEQIADMSAESDVLLKLRPVSFYYRPELDETHLRQYGLVAEEVAEVAPGLVAYDQDGAPQTVRYHFVNAMLLSEVQKQRRQLEAQEAEIRELRAQQSQLQELKDQLARLEARLGQ